MTVTELQRNCNEKESTEAKRFLTYTVSMQSSKQIENEAAVGNKFFMNIAPVATKTGPTLVGILSHHYNLTEVMIQ